MDDSDGPKGVRNAAEFLNDTRVIMAQKQEVRRRTTPGEFRIPSPVHIIQQFAGMTFVLLGTTIVVILVYKDLIIGEHHSNSMHAWMLTFAVLFGFTGFYIFNPRLSKDALITMADVGTSILVAIRTGRRKDDVKVVALPVSTPSAGSGAGTPDIEMPPTEKQPRLNYDAGRTRRGEGE